jgi:hypothetical protein
MTLFKFFVYYDDPFLLNVIIVIIATFSIKRQSIFHDYYETEITGEIEKGDGMKDRQRRQRQRDRGKK